MTSTTFSLNGTSQFRRVYQWALKKNVGMMALLALLLFLANPLILLISMQGRQDSLEESVAEGTLTRGQVATELSKAYSELVGSALPAIAIALVLLFCAILCVGLFGYMQKRRSVDLFHALPVGRGPMLLGRWCAGLTVLFVPMVLDSVFQSIIGAAYGVSVQNGTRPPFIMLLWILLMGTAAFTSCVFLMVCTGTTLDAVLSALGVNIGYPLLILCGFSICAMMLPGFYEDAWKHPFIMTAFAPFAAAFTAVLQQHSFRFLLWWLVLTALMLAGSVFLYRRRKSEAAENNFAFPLPKLIVRFLVTAVGGLGFGLFLSGTAGTGKGFLIGVLFGSVAAHVIVEAVYERGFKTLKRSFAWYGAFAAAFLVFYGLLCTGVFGYDTRIPNADEVESITVNSQNYWTGTGSQEIFNQSSSHRWILSPIIKDKSNIKTVIGIQQNLIRQYRTQYPYRIKKNLGNGLKLSYKLKNGRVFERDYRSYSDNMNLEKMLNPAYDKLTGMKEFAETSDLLFYVEPEDIKSIDVYGGKASSKTFVPDAKAAKQFQKALEQDFYDGKIDRPYQNEGKDLPDQVEIALNYRDKVVPKSEKLKVLLGGYQGKINIMSGNYSFSAGGSATGKLFKQWGWI